MTDQPAFEFTDKDGKSYRIFANGQTAGFDAFEPLKTGRIVNRIPVMVDRARLEGRRMSHLADKVGQDTKNLRECAGKLPAGPHRDYLNGLADKLAAMEEGPELRDSESVEGSQPGEQS